MSESKFSGNKGILFAADLPDQRALYLCLDEIADEIDAIKLGNTLLYEVGVKLITDLKKRYSLPVVADIKITDTSHIATRVAQSFANAGADALTISGICGRTVFRDVRKTLSDSCELWIFSEFTHDDGLVDAELADLSIRSACQEGLAGIQVPGTRTHRIEDVRSDVGNHIVIIACGIGIQGGRFGSAILHGANYEIIGRAIYGQSSPRLASQVAKEAIKSAALTYAKRVMTHE